MTEIKQLNPNQNHQTTNAMLWQLYDELNRLPNILKHLLRSKIQEFDKNNGLRFRTIQEEIGKLQEQHFVVISGQIQMQTPLLDDKGSPVNPNEQPKPKLQEGFTDADFNAAVQKLMAKTTIIA